MTPYLLMLLCCLGLATLCGLLMLAIRQIGVLKRRMELVEGEATAKPSRLIGKTSPLTRFNLLDGSAIQLPLDINKKTYLVFISFTCSLCRPVLHRLFELPADIKARTILMYLQDDVTKRFTDEIRQLGLDTFQQIQAMDYVEHFETEGAPYLIVLNTANVIIDARPTLNWDVLSEYLFQHEKEDVTVSNNDAVSIPATKRNQETVYV